MRIVVDGGGRSGRHHDQRASVEDIRMSTTALLQQMKSVGNSSDPRAVDPSETLSTGSQTARKEPMSTPKMKTTTTKSTASPENVVGTTWPTEEDAGGLHDCFLSVEELKVLQQACEIAGVPADSPDSVLQASEALHSAFQLSASEGGVGFSPHEAQAFMRKVAVDRAGLSRVGREAAETEAKLCSDEADAKSQLEEAEAALSLEEKDGDGTLLDTLMRVKHVKARALQKAKEERERKMALEAASQAALRRMGVCPAGFQWNRQGDGWRCAGGSHYVSGGAVAAEMARGVGSG